MQGVAVLCGGEFYAELAELCNPDNCTWTWQESGNTEFGGVAGYKVQSNKEGFSDNYIFLPATGFRTNDDLLLDGSDGYYWAADLDMTDSARCLNFGATYHYTSNSGRCNGRCVRPVFGEGAATDGIVTMHNDEYIMHNTARKVLSHGRLVIVKDGQEYDITGRRLRM